MKLAWHIVRKDLFRLRWVIRAWALLTVAQFVFAYVFAGTGAIEFYAVTWAVACLIVPLAFIGLLVGLQGEDSVATRDEFWVTRPISSLQLLGAKAIAVALFLLVPLGAGLVWWLLHDFTVPQVANAALHTMQWHGLLLLAAAPLTMITRGPKEFFLALISTVAVAGILYACGTWLSPVAQSGTTGQDTRGWGVVGLAVATVLVVTGIQYRAGRRSLSILVMLLALLVGFIGWTQWKFDASVRALAAPANRDSIAGRVSYETAVKVARSRAGQFEDVMLDGKGWRAQLMVSAAVHPESAVYLDGHGVRLVAVIPNAEGGPVVSTAQIRPEFTHFFRRYLFGEEVEEAWTVEEILGADGRGLWGRPLTVPLSINVAAVMIQADTLQFAPAVASGEKLPENVGTWLNSAEIRLLRVGPLPTSENPPGK
jgi:hypothetical protein